MLATPNIELKYINDAKQELMLAPLSSFFLKKVDETVKNQISSQKQVSTHGKFFTGMSLDERNIVITGEVKDTIDPNYATSRLHQVFNPTLAGVLYYFDKKRNVKLSINCRVSSFPKTYWSRGTLFFDIQLVCLDPFWQGLALTENIAITKKMFYFPLKIIEGQFTFGIRKRQLETKFENVGNVESGFIVNFRAVGGTVKNPSIINKITEEQIKILYSMQKDDEIVVVNRLQEKQILINGTNGFRYYDAKNSTFFKIAVGTNIIGYSADENINNLLVSVSYIPNFTSVEV